LFHTFYIYSDYNLLLGGLVLILTPCVLILRKKIESVVSKYIETAHLFYGLQCPILPCCIIRFPFPLFVCFFSQIQCNNNKKSKSVVSKYNRDCAFISWFSVSNLVVLYYSFFLFLVCLQEKSRGQSAARRQRMLAVCVRVFLFYAGER
jgi:hypothetical protein